MSDPFTFDPTRVVRDPVNIRGIKTMRFSYAMPIGQPLEYTLLRFDFDQDRESEDPSLNYTLPLRVDFEEMVAGLSAHQRLAWMAAAQKEAADV